MQVHVRLRITSNIIINIALSVGGAWVSLYHALPYDYNRADSLTDSHFLLDEVAYR